MEEGGVEGGVEGGRDGGEGGGGGGGCDWSPAAAVAPPKTPLLTALYSVTWVERARVNGAELWLPSAVRLKAPPCPRQLSAQSLALNLPPPPPTPPPHLPPPSSEAQQDQSTAQLKPRHVCQRGEGGGGEGGDKMCVHEGGRREGLGGNNYHSWGWMEEGETTWYEAVMSSLLSRTTRVCFCRFVEIKMN